MSISVVVVGRNASEQLGKMYGEDRSSLSFAEEVLYIDSASTDDSCDVARSFGWRVFRLDSKGVLSASAGRHVGAIEARGKFILFLDSDMKFETPLSGPQLNEMLRSSSDDTAGWTGAITDHYPSGNTRRRSCNWNDGAVVAFFSGFVFLNRRALLAAGNWGISVLANEEIELYARMRSMGHRVRFSELLHCRHFTAEASGWTALRSAYVPLTGRERVRFGSYGFALRSALSSGTIPQLVWIAPEPVLTCACLMCLFLPAPALALIPAAVLIAVVLSRRSPAYLVVCPARVLHLIAGVVAFRRRPLMYHSVTEAPRG